MSQTDQTEMMIHIVLIKVLLISILSNWNIVTYQQVTCLLLNFYLRLILNTPRHPIPDTPKLPQIDINSKESVRRIIESET